MSSLKKCLVTFVLVTTACSGGSSEDSSAASDSEGPGETTESVVEETQAAVEVQAEVEDEPGLPLADGVDIEQLTAKSGGGPRPMLAWSPVSGADSYTVVVYNGEGEAWWSWSGSDTEVIIGGVDTDVEIGGPRASEGARWVVMAFDSEGNITGTSPHRSIEP